MRAFRNIPIKQKLIQLVMLTTGVVLFLACTSFITYELITFRQAAHNNLSTIAEVIANTSTAAVRFDDTKAALEMLSALKAEENVVAAAIYKKGHLLAYYPPDLNPKVLPERPPMPGHHFQGRQLEVAAPVYLETRQIGVIYLKSNLGGMYERLKLYAVIVFIVLITSLAVAFMLSNTLQQRVSQPILDLAKAARLVSEQQDYSIRVEKHGQDELGQLTDAFNEMLGEIHERDLALSQNAERLQLALQASHTSTWSWDVAQGRMVWDEFGHPLFGMASGTSLQTFDDFIAHVHPDDQEQVRKATTEALTNKRDFDTEFRVVWPDGTTHYLTSRGRAFYGPTAEPVRMTGVCMDITGRKQSEEQIRRLNAELEQRVLERTAELQAANHELEAFTYSVSHDLRAPLRHIDGYAQILQEQFGGILSEEGEDYIDRIRRSTKHLGQLVDDLLRLSRVGRQDLTKLSTDLKELVSEVITEFKTETDGRQVEWKIGELPRVYCDPILMQQVFANLISNALKYTRKREKAIIEIGQTTIEGQKVIFVRDNGVGFNMKYSNKLFGVFQRLHRSEDFEGTGVGLATVDRIIRRHGGRIWAEAEVDRGASFYFTLSDLESS